MNIYLIYQDENTGLNTYDSAVVIAESEEEARKIDPGEGIQPWAFDSPEWVSPENVKVKFLGVAAEGLPVVVCASYNAG